jgi:ABC-type transporter Mla maintaining outer membrane lipid asymmetry ATPase subunit MlaF
MIDVTVPRLRDPSATVLEAMHWAVAPGDYWAVGGLLGSGKSDLMALAAGLSRPLRGTLRVFGQELTARYEPDRPPALRKVGLVFDGGQLLHHLTLAENVALPLQYFPGESEPTDRIRALLDLTGIEPWLEKLPGQVSRNWQQRIGLARALALGPEMLLLDAPLTGLDPREAAWWLDILESLSTGHPIAGGRPITIIVTADDLRPWIEHARQFAVLRDRTFISLGDRAAALENAEPLLQDLLRRSTSRKRETGGRPQ